MQTNDGSVTESAVLAGGCFWCLEAVYERVKGVAAVENGYANGHTQNPTYEQVCSGNTGFAEVVKITFDPAVITYRDLLEIFFVIHDPTTLNRQGADVGEQYRSAILTCSDQQHQTAVAVIEDLAENGVFDDPIVTVVEPLRDYYRAEDYHQHYFENHPQQGYCQMVVGPKVAKFRQKFVHWLKN